MPDDAPTPAASGIVFGIAEYNGDVAGVHLQNLDFGETASTAEALDEDGNVEQIDVYGAKQTVQGDGNVVSGAAVAIHVRGTVTFNDVTYKITSCNKKYSVNGHCTFSFSGEAPKPAESSGSGTTT